MFITGMANNFFIFSPYSNVLVKIDEDRIILKMSAGLMNSARKGASGVLDQWED